MEKNLILGKFEGKRRREWQRMRWLDNITNPTDMSLCKLQEIVKEGSPVCLVHEIAESDLTEQLNNSDMPGQVWSIGCSLLNPTLLDNLFVQ